MPYKYQNEESLKNYPAIQMTLAKEAKNTLRFFKTEDVLCSTI